MKINIHMSAIDVELGDLVLVPSKDIKCIVVRDGSKFRLWDLRDNSILQDNADEPIELLDRYFNLAEIRIIKGTTLELTNKDEEGNIVW